MPVESYQRNRARRPQSFTTCVQCGELFGPLPRLSQTLCSNECRIKHSRKEKRKPRQKPTRAARYAQRRIAYLVDIGRIMKPTACEQCGGERRRLEAAHYSYDEPERVRWLCRSCHSKWDWAEPKGGTH